MKWLKNLCEWYLAYHTWSLTKKRVNRRQCPDCGSPLECTNVADHFVMFYMKCANTECGHEFRLCNVEVRPVCVDRLPSGKRIWNCIGVKITREQIRECEE